MVEKEETTRGEKEIRTTNARYSKVKCVLHEMYFSFAVILLVWFLSFRTRYTTLGVYGLGCDYGEYDGGKARFEQKERLRKARSSLFLSTPISNLVSPPTSQPFSLSLSLSLFLSFSLSLLLLFYPWRNWDRVTRSTSA